MPNDRWHTQWGMFFLGGLLVLMYFVNFFSQTALGVAALGYIFGIFFFNPDTFTPSASQRRWGPLKIIFRNPLWRFEHHGVSHNPFMWIGFYALTLLVCIRCHYDKLYAMFMLGIVANAILHLICDLVMILMHKSKVPILKDI